MESLRFLSYKIIMINNKLINKLINKLPQKLIHEYTLFKRVNEDALNCNYNCLIDNELLLKTSIKYLINK